MIEAGAGRGFASRTWTLAVALLLWATPVRPAPPQDRPPVFGAGVGVVRLDVIVLDAAGRPVPGLTAADFVVEEDGRSQAITSFEPVVVQASARPSAVSEPPRVSVNRTRSPQDGRCVFLFVDDVHLTAPVAEQVRASLRGFLDSEVREGDWVTLMAPEQNLWWTARDGWEYRQLRRAVDGIKGRYVRDPLREGMSDWEAVCLEEYANDPAQAICEAGRMNANGSRANGLAATRARRTASEGDGSPAGDQTGASSADAGTQMTSLADEISRQVARPVTAGSSAALARRRIALTLDGLRQALASLLPLRGHKSLVLISEGFVLLPKMPGYAELIDAARRANVAVHFLDPRGPDSGYTADSQDGFVQPGFAPRREMDRAGAGDLASATGGHAFTGNDAVNGLRTVAAESEVYYLLGYTPDVPRPGERRLRVRVTRAGCSVRARTRYLAARPAAEAKAEKPQPDAKTGLDAHAVAAMRALPDATELQLKVATLFFEANAAGEVGTLLAAEAISPGGLGGVHQFKVAAEVRRVDGGSPLQERFERSVTTEPEEPAVLARQWRLPAGAWQVRLLVEDAATGRVGTAVHTFEVPRPDALRLSTPLMTGALEADASGAMRPRLSLDRLFPPGGRVYCQFSVYGAGRDTGGAPQVRTRWELRRGDWLVHESEPALIQPRPDGGLSQLVVVPLEGAPPGDYTLTLTVEDRTTHTSLSRTEAFTVGS